MIVCEFKVKGKDSQYPAIDEAIRTSQFIQNKYRRYYGMDNKNIAKNIGRDGINKYGTVLTKKFTFAKELNSMGRQSAAERSWSALAQLYDNCKNNDY
ncbi:MULTISPECIES: hypothetical protein [Oscillatoriales]|uniref:hypothetical protein n=1 Tax=Oscillatoriophycideae TaxID=1301283 RepID=UPI001F54DF0B|nr:MULTISPECIES: hypothetical protein [Oscillatoriales]